MKILRVMFAFLCAMTLTSGCAEEIYVNSRPFAKGDTARLASVMRRAAAGEKIVLGVIGGSITEGYNATRPQNKYAEIVLSWWRDKFPTADITLVNAGIGGTNSYLGVHRAYDDLLIYKPDFVIVEFSVNDGNDYFYQKSYDNLVRRILLSEGEPACLLLFMTTEGGVSAVQVHSNIGFRYGLQMISYENAVTREIENGRLKWRDISSDNVHPNDKGHALCADLICAYLSEVYSVYESADAPKPFTAPPATVETYMNARLVKAKDISTRYGYQLKRVAGAYPEGLCGAGEISFELEFRNFGILHLRMPDGHLGKFDVYVDGVRKATLDSDFAGGWGAYAEAVQIYSSKATEKHTVTITPATDEAHLFTLLGLLIS